MVKHLIGFMLCVIMSSSNATLLSRDLFDSGDGLLTYDTETGLEWLDESAIPSLTWTQFIDGVDGWRDLGFRFAGSTETNQLLRNAGATKIVWAISLNNGDIATETANLLLSEFGISNDFVSPLFTNLTQGTTTISSDDAQYDNYSNLFWDYQIGDTISFDDPFYLRYFTRPPGGAYIYEWGPGGQNPDCQYLVGNENADGCLKLNTAMVRVSPVPIPAAVWLFSSGLIGLFGIARRKS